MKLFVLRCTRTDKARVSSELHWYKSRERRRYADSEIRWDRNCSHATYFSPTHPGLPHREPRLYELHAINTVLPQLQSSEFPNSDSYWSVAGHVISYPIIRFGYLKTPWCDRELDFYRIQKSRTVHEGVVSFAKSLITKEYLGKGPHSTWHCPVEGLLLVPQTLDTFFTAAWSS